MLAVPLCDAIVFTEWHDTALSMGQWPVHRPSIVKTRSHQTLASTQDTGALTRCRPLSCPNWMYATRNKHHITMHTASRKPQADGRHRFILDTNSPLFPLCYTAMFFWLADTGPCACSFFCLASISTQSRRQRRQTPATALILARDSGHSTLVPGWGAQRLVSPVRESPMRA